MSYKVKCVLLAVLAVVLIAAVIVEINVLSSKLDTPVAMIVR